MEVGCIMSSVMDLVLLITANGASCRLIEAKWHTFNYFLVFIYPGTAVDIFSITAQNFHQKNLFYTLSEHLHCLSTAQENIFTFYFTK